jgi:hypothetical protein
MKCDKCGSEKITYYKQRRKDKVIVVTARCENNHHPVTGKPFYPISQFDISALDILPGSHEIRQTTLLSRQEPEHPQTLLEWVEWKRSL